MTAREVRVCMFGTATASLCLLPSDRDHHPKRSPCNFFREHLCRYRQLQQTLIGTPNASLACSNTDVYLHI
jgi:hypothetical protein